MFQQKISRRPPTLAATQSSVGRDIQRLTDMARLQFDALLQTITVDALNHPRDLTGYLAEREGVTRGTAGKALKKMVDGGWLLREGRSRPTFRPGVQRQVVRSYALAGLEEHLPWKRDFSPAFELPVHVRRIAQHAFTELLNNAIDHSGGRQATVSMRCNGQHLHLLVSDDGCGVFEKIGAEYGIDDPQEAMLELSKGKLTTAPGNHSGRGLFFTSRLADIFDLHANQFAFQHSQWARRDWLRNNPAKRPGTAVFMSIALDTPRTLEQVLQQHSSGDSAVTDFARTVVPLRLIGRDDNPLLSRSQGRRVVSRLQEFAIAELDFSGVNEIGQAFADEVFRVFARAHPDLRLEAHNMNPAVAAMVAGARAS